MRVCWFAVAASMCVVILSGTAQGQQSGWFGAEVVDVTKAEADKLGWDAPHGAKVSKVEPGSPAEKAGLKAGDIILVLDRTEIDNGADFDAAIAGKAPGHRGAPARSVGRARAARRRGAGRPAEADGRRASDADPAARHRRAYGAHRRPGLHARRQVDRLGRRRQGDPRLGLAGGHDRAQIRGQVGARRRRQDLRHGPVARWTLAGGRRMRSRSPASRPRRCASTTSHRPAGGAAQGPHQCRASAWPSRPTARS